MKTGDLSLVNRFHKTQNLLKFAFWHWPRNVVLILLRPKIQALQNIFSELTGNCPNWQVLQNWMSSPQLWRFSCLFLALVWRTFFLGLQQCRYASQSPWNDDLSPVVLPDITEINPAKTQTKHFNDLHVAIGQCLVEKYHYRIEELPPVLKLGV